MDKQKQKFEKIFAGVTKKKNIHEAVLFVESGAKDFSCSFNYGKKNLDTPFLIASITKLMTTACIFILTEQGKLTLNDSLTRHLPEAVTDSLHRFKGKDYSHQLTLTHLLSQTSGLRDAVEEGSGAAKKRGVVEDRYIPFKEHLAGTKEIGALFPPGAGKRANYTNINFDLLGEVIECVAAMPLANVYQKLVFEPLGLAKTYLPTSEEDIVPSVYYQDLLLHRPNLLKSIRASGGCISTARELMIFLKAFFQGKLFSREKFIANEMDHRLQMAMTPMRYQFGFMKIALGEFATLFMGKGDLIGHAGSTGSFAFYHPSSDLFFVGDVNQMANPAIPVRLSMRLAMAVH